MLRWLTAQVVEKESPQFIRPGKRIVRQPIDICGIPHFVKSRDLPLRKLRQQI